MSEETPANAKLFKDIISEDDMSVNTSISENSENSTEKLSDRTPEQLDTDYMEAVNNGDMETAGRLVDKAAKKAMPTSCVRDQDGKLKIMYHGTSNAGFTVFDTYSGNFGLFGLGSYFTDNKAGKHRGRFSVLWI